MFFFFYTLLWCLCAKKGMPRPLPPQELKYNSLSLGKIWHFDNTERSYVVPKSWQKMELERLYSLQAGFLASKEQKGPKSSYAAGNRNHNLLFMFRIYGL